jgi:uncharacterized protein
MFDAPIVKLINWIHRRRKVRARPGEMLLLLPHCLQWQKCPHNVIATPENCKACGRCSIKDLTALAKRLGVPCAVVAGGRQAVLRVKDPSVKAVLAVACEKELREGLMAVFPKPAMGIVNLRPHGPCVDTSVDVDVVEKAIREILIDEPSS